MRLLLLCIVIICAILIQTSIQVPTKKPRVIIDLDVGSDDAYALNILLYAEKIGQIKVEAIICSTGNSELTNVCKNVIRILEVLKRTDIPVYKGASRPIVPITEYLPRRYFYGRDGFGNVEHDWEPDLNIIREEPASIAIHELVKNNPGEITLICLSPLTTIALTMMMFEDFAPNLKEIWIMGGNYRVPGNLTEAAEFNFFMDPESANVVLHNGSCPIILLTWETCLDVDITLDWRFNVLAKQQSPFMNLMNNFEMSVFRNMSLDTFWGACDAFIASVVVQPQIILKKSFQEANVELHNRTDRGRVEFQDYKDERKNILLIERIDTEAVKNIILEVTDCIWCY